MILERFLAWLREWLHTHPLRAPVDMIQASYTKEVMARVRTSRAPALAWRWLPRPRAVFALGTAAACGVTLVVLLHRAPIRLATQIEQSWELLTEIGELDAVPASHLEEEARLLDHLTLAEAEPASDDEGWIEDTVELLSGVDETSTEASDEESLEELLKELELLDESEMASS